MTTKHVAYVASPSQSDSVRETMTKMKSRPYGDKSSLSQGWEMDHPILKGMTLRLHLLNHISAVTPHLRQYPVDLLVYDERGEDAIEAKSAIELIRSDVNSFSDLWGPDFIFPASRIVTVLDGEKAEALGVAQAHRAFELGRSHVRDVCIDPKNTTQVMKWMQEILSYGSDKQKKVGVAMSGGGLEGFLYQLGVTYALERAIEGKTIREADVFSGVSSGSIATTLLAANVSTLEVIKALHGKSEKIEPFTSSTVFDLASTSIVTRIIRESVSWNGLDPMKWVKQALKAVPTGFFRGDNLRAYIRQCLASANTPDSFPALDKELYIGSTDMDSFEHVVFGTERYRDVPISEAIYASCALPLFFVPNQIEGRWYIDGQITKTCNLELVVEKGCDLIFIIDPVKPLGSIIPGTVDKKGGYYSMIQTVKALVYTRFHSVLSHLTERYPDTDFVVFQPDDEVAQLMAGSPMRYTIRTQLIALAYQQTQRQLRERHRVYSAKLEKHGMFLRSQEELKAIEVEDANLFEDLSKE